MIVQRPQKVREEPATYKVAEAAHSSRGIGRNPKRDSCRHYSASPLRSEYSDSACCVPPMARLVRRLKPRAIHRPFFPMLGGKCDCLCRGRYDCPRRVF